MNNEIIKFINGDLQLDVTVSPNNETVWLIANQMALLFDRDEKTIRKHINRLNRHIGDLLIYPTLIMSI